MVERAGLYKLINTLHDLDKIIVIEIFEVKVVYTIYPQMGFYQGITVINFILLEMVPEIILLC